MNRQHRRVNEQPELLPPPLEFEPPPNGNNPAPDQVFAPGSLFAVENILPSMARKRRAKPGRGHRSKGEDARRTGYAIGATRPTDSVQDVAVAATLRAAALRQGGTNGEAKRRRGEEAKNPRVIASSRPRLITSSDLRVKVRRARTGNLVLFVVDASGSMGARKRMVAVKGAILSLLLDAYQKRDRVGLITFRGQDAELLVPPTNSVELAERCLRQMPTGGKTPLAAGLFLAQQTLERSLKQDAALSPLLVLVTDGRANVGQTAQLRRVATMLAQTETPSLLLDSEQGFVKMGAAQELALWLEADYMPLDRLQARDIARQVRGKLGHR